MIRFFDSNFIHEPILSKCLFYSSYFCFEVDWKTARFQLKANDANNDNINQDDIIDSTNAELSADAVADFDSVKLRDMLGKLETIINSLDNAKRQDKRSIAHKIKNMSKDIKNMIHTWVANGPEFGTEDESSSSGDGGNEERQEICLSAHQKLKNWVKKLKTWSREKGARSSWMERWRLASSMIIVANKIIHFAFH